MEQLHTAITRIASSGDEIFGAGFLVGERRILTCAHVVAAALGGDGHGPMPADPVQVDFPFLEKGKWLSARAIFWRPVRREATDGEEKDDAAAVGEQGEDICVLELDGDPPARSAPALLLPASNVWDHEFGVLGFPAGRDSGVFATGKLLGMTADGWLQGEATEGFGFSVTEGFSGAPVWDVDLPGMIGMVVAFETGANYRVAYILPATQLLASCPDLQSGIIPEVPYKGLDTFDQGDANIFFGREQDTKDLRKAVQHKPLVVLAGASGAGKSSLVFAGLLPQLARERDWLTLRMHPGKTPLKELASVFAEQLEGERRSNGLAAATDALLADLKEEGTLRRVGELLLRQHPTKGNLLLVVDQFEELYSECLVREDRERFIDILLQTARSSSGSAPQVRIVVTVRLDFLNAAAEYGPLANALNGATIFLGAMNRRQLRAAVERPAQLKGARFEDGLSDLILDEVGPDQANLPLLEFALALLWDRREKGELSIKAYQEIGGVKKALAGRAQAVFEELSPDDKRRAERIFIQLVVPGDGTPATRRSASRAEVGEENWDIVTRLADKRLLVCDQDTVTLVHEALIGGWEQLGTWIEANKEFRIWQEELRTAMHLWERNGRDKGWLLRDTPLSTALGKMDERKKDLTEAEQAFIETSAEVAAERDRLSEDIREDARAKLDQMRKEVVGKAVDPPIYMSLWRALVVWSIISSLVLVVYLALPVLPSAELASYNLLFQLRGSRAARHDIVILQMDRGASLSASAGQVAKTIDYLRRAGAKAIGLDLPYSDAQSGPGYARLAKAIQRAKNVVVAGQLTNNIPDNQLSGVTWAYHPPDSFVYRAQCGLTLPAWTIGGAVRSIDLMQAGPEVETVCGKPGYQAGREYPSLAAELVAVADHEPVSKVIAGLNRHTMLVNFIGPAGGDQKPFEVRQLSSVTGEDPSHFKSAIVLIVPAEDGGNTVGTPYGQMFEPYVQANALNTILSSNAIIPAGDPANAAILLVAALAAALLAARLTIGLGAVAAAVVAVLVPVAALILFDISHIWIEVVTPVVAVLLVLSVCLVLRFAAEERQGRRKRHIMRVLSALRIGNEAEDALTPAEAALAGTSRTITLLSIRAPGFMGLSKTMKPRQVIACLDIVLPALTETVQEHRGTVERYHGDGLTAVWNAPRYQPDHAMLAVLAAMKIIERMEEVNRQLAGAGLPAIQYGVGITTDRAVLGEIGSQSDRQFGVVGDIVSVGAQLSRAAHTGNIIVSESTWQIVGDRFVAPEVEPLIAKESGQIIRTFQVIGVNTAAPELETAPLAGTLVTGRTN